MSYNSHIPPGTPVMSIKEAKDRVEQSIKDGMSRHPTGFQPHKLDLIKLVRLVWQEGYIQGQMSTCRLPHADSPVDETIARIEQKLDAVLSGFGVDYDTAKD